MTRFVPLELGPPDDDDDFVGVTVNGHVRREREPRARTATARRNRKWRERGYVPLEDADEIDHHDE